MWVKFIHTSISFIKHYVINLLNWYLFLDWNSDLFLKVTITKIVPSYQVGTNGGQPIQIFATNLLNSPLQVQIGNSNVSNAVYGNNINSTYFNITSPPQNSFGSYSIKLKFGTLTSWISGNQNYSYLSSLPTNTMSPPTNTMSPPPNNMNNNPSKSLIIWNQQI